MTKGINFVVGDIKLTDTIIDEVIIRDASTNFLSNFNVCDGTALKSELQRYINVYRQDNLFTYSLCLHTWGALWDDTLEYGTALFVGLIRQNGLVQLITMCDSIANQIQYDINTGDIRSYFSDDVYLITLEQLLNNEYAHELICRLANAVLRSKSLTLKKLLQLLKYPKRICIKDDFLLQHSIDDFLRVEQRNRALDRQALPTWLLLGLRSEAEELYGDFTYAPPTMEDLANVGLPTGSTYFGKLTRLEKIALFVSEYPDFVTNSYFDSVTLDHSIKALQRSIIPYDVMVYGDTCIYTNTKNPLNFKDADSRIEATKFGNTSTADRLCSRLPIFDSEFDVLHVSDNHVFRLTHRAARVVPVPKSYKAARIIAMEHPVNYLKQKHLAEAIDRFFSKERFHGAVNIHSQQHSIDLCREGALTSDLITIDHSHASDTVRKSVCRDILPQKLANALLSVVPDYIYVNGKLRPLSMLATSGCACTFNAEILIFYLAARYAVKISGGGLSDLSQIAVYGDDVIIPKFAAEAYCEITSRLGLIVNIEKSFAGDEELRYREACGAEYIGDALTGDIYDTKCVYYPRRFLRGSTTSLEGYNFDGEVENDLTALVSLQHRLCSICMPAADIVTNVVRQLYPRMTSSPIGTECSDLWEIVPQYQRCSAPYLRSVNIDHYDDQGHYTNTETVQLPEPNTAWSTRQCHSMAIVQYKQPKSEPNFTISINDEAIDDEFLKYRLFLFFGPEYADLLMKTLRVSQSRRVHLYSRLPLVSWDERKI